jgi:hypothetical protein
MVRHTINLDDMLAWIDAKNDEAMTYASCATKRLVVKLSGGYRVLAGDFANDKVSTVYDGTDGKSAIDAYNAIP